MNYSESKQDIFKLDKKYYIVHALSSKYGCFGELSKKLNNLYNIENELNLIGNHTCPDCLKISNTYSLIVKTKNTIQPKYEDVEKALLLLKEDVMKSGIKYLAFPKICCGKDKLEWNKIKIMIFNIFKNEDINILICV